MQGMLNNPPPEIRARMERVMPIETWESFMDGGLKMAAIKRHLEQAVLEGRSLAPDQIRGLLEMLGESIKATEGAVDVMTQRLLEGGVQQVP